MRVVIADDATLWREGLARLLVEAGVEPVALVGDPDALRGAVARLRPDVAIVDVRMPPSFTNEGLVAAAELKQTYPSLGVVVLSQTVDPVRAAELLRMHPRGCGYLLKDRVLDVDTLVAALNSVIAGGSALDPDVVAALVHRHSSRSTIDRLTEREREVLALMATGLSNVAIARTMQLSGKTIETHVSRVFTKLDLPPEPDQHRRVLAVVAFLRDAR